MNKKIKLIAIMRHNMRSWHFCIGGWEVLDLENVDRKFLSCPNCTPFATQLRVPQSTEYCNYMEYTVSENIKTRLN